MASLLKKADLTRERELRAENRYGQIRTEPGQLRPPFRRQLTSRPVAKSA